MKIKNFNFFFYIKKEKRKKKKEKRKRIYSELLASMEPSNVRTNTFTSKVFNCATLNSRSLSIWAQTTNRSRTPATTTGRESRAIFPTMSLSLSLSSYSIVFVVSLVIHHVHGFFVLQKAVKKKGAYPLRPGVQGFFITCDGGRERQASHEAINVIDSVCLCVFYYFVCWN